MIFDLLFGCRHKQLTRPITPHHRPGTKALRTYVSCLECGKQFDYDVEKMHVVKDLRVRTEVLAHRSGDGDGIEFESAEQPSEGRRYFIL